MKRRKLAVALVATVGLLAPTDAAAAAPSQPAQAADAAENKAQAKTLMEFAGGEANTLSSSAALVPHRPSRNVQVSQNQDPAEVFRSGASEVTIASSAGGARNVVGWNDGEGFGFAPFTPGQPPLGLSGYGFSSDFGRTWTDGGAPPIGDTVAFGPGPEGRSETGRYVTRGDPWLDVDGRGNYFYANLAVWEDDAQSPPAGISLHRGSFHGRNFSWDDSVLIQSPNYPNDFLDKEALAVDGRGGPTEVYISTTNFEETCNIGSNGFGTIEMYRSLDGGDNWDRNIIQPDETFITDPDDPNCGTDGIINQGSTPAIGPNGEVYVAWERGWFAPETGGSELDRATIAFASSDDQGASFSAPAEVASICSMAQNAPAAYNRTSSNDFPRIDVARRGLHKGRIYITYQDCSASEGSAPFGADTDVYVTFSDDGGATWSDPTAVHALADGKAQFWPIVSVGAFGQVDVTYYEMTDVNVTPDPADIECSVRIGGPLDDPDLKQSTVTTFSEVMTARSWNGGASFGTPRRVNDATTNWCAATPINSIIPNFGDYNDAVTGVRLQTVWADGRNAGVSDRVPTSWYGAR